MYLVFVGAFFLVVHMPLLHLLLGRLGFEHYQHSSWSMWKPYNTDKQQTHDIALYFGDTYIIINICRKWNDELEETIKKLRQFLEERCDAYFVDIKQRAVKVAVTYCHYSYKTVDPI